jgi:hypothetical protein
MDRAALLHLARKHGFREGSEPWARGKKRPLVGSGLEELRKELKEYFEAPDGQAAISQAPGWLRQKPVDEIIDLLLREVT